MGRGQYEGGVARIMGRVGIRGGVAKIMGRGQYDRGDNGES